jgi:flagellar biosynthesis/type III secretory pathway protein FliH
MFDPASNPFAVQNLLDRTATPFVEQRDQIPEAIFGVDPLAGGRVAGGFARDHSLDLPEDDFALYEVIADPFLADDDLPVPGFAAEAASEIGAEFATEHDVPLTTVARSFEADADTDTDTDADANSAASLTDEVVPGQAQHPASEIEAFAAATDAMFAEISAADPLSELANPSLAVASDEDNTQAASDIAGRDTVASDAAAGDTAAPVNAEAGTQAAAEGDLVKHTDTPPKLATEPHLLPETLSAQAAELLEDALLDNEAVAQKIEAARTQAYAEGLEAGRNEGREAERPVAHQQGYDEGMAAGLEQGRAETQTDEQKRQQTEHEAKLAQLQSVIEQLQQLAYNPDVLFEPMKKFTVHLAEQLVRGELTQSPQVISRLVDNALRELNAAGDKAVIIHLHPEDLELYRPTVAKYTDSLILRPDNLLERGSVRVSLDGSVVEDLMQRRVEGVKKSLAQAPTPNWRTGGNRLSDRLSDPIQTGQPVDDVTIVDKPEAVADKTLEAAAPSDGHA